MRLEPKDHIWMCKPAVVILFEAFPKDSLRFVGGCVRNALLGAPVSDIDLCTQLNPMEMTALLTKAKIKFVETGIDHGTLTVIIDGEPYEITSLRRDVETDGRHAVVSFTQDWSEDAQRRDFTMNAIYADISGELFDPTGEGLTDLEARRFRFVGDAPMRIREDYLRLLRYFRFLAWYGGEAALDKEALKACRELKSGLKTLSVERIWAELKKLLSAPDPARIIRIMSQQDILDVLLPEASNAEGLALYLELEKAQGWAIDPLIRLMSLAARDGAAITRLCQRLKMSKLETKRLYSWASDEAALSADMSEKAIKAAIYKSGGDVIKDRAYIRAAGAQGTKRKSWLALAGFAESWEAPTFPLTGKDMQKLGIEPGPQMGKALQAAEALWVRSDFKTNKDQLLLAVQMVSGAMGQKRP